MFSSATSFFGARSAATAVVHKCPEPATQERTLAHLMRSAATKSRRLSSSKSTASMREVILQNRIVKVINRALAEHPLDTHVNALDSNFIDRKKPQFKLSPLAAVFIPASTAHMSEELLPSIDSEEFEEPLQHQPATEPDY